jgi:hypothetical protein
MQKGHAVVAWPFFFQIIAGDHLISHTVSRAVPSAQRGLTSVFGMGTGDPSQYGHRQIVRGNEILRSRSEFRLKAHALENASTWLALGGWLPAAAAASDLSRISSPGPDQERGCNLAP